MEYWKYLIATLSMVMLSLVGGIVVYTFLGGIIALSIYFGTLIIIGICLYKYITWKDKCPNLR